MSTWISRILTAAAVFGLAACEGGIDVGRSAPQRMAVAGNAVTVGGPPGYCVDPSASRDGVEAVVLLASCASIAGNPLGPKPDTPAIVTVVVSSDPGSFIDVAGTQDLLTRYFRSEAGRAALSRSGNPGSVAVTDVRRAGGAIYLRVRDTSPGLVAGLDNEYWRALLDVNGRLVTVSVTGFESRPMSAGQGLDVLEAATRRIRAESSGSPA